MTQVIVKDGGSTRTVELTKEVTSIGRTSNNEIILSNSNVSRIHAQIKKTDAGYVIADFDSRNGIFFKGERIKKKTLEPGDEIEIGDATIIFEKEITKPADPQILIPTGLSADEFIGPTQPHFLAVLLRVLIIVCIIGIVVGYGYIKIQDQTNQNTNYVGIGASFEEFNPDLFPAGWQPTLGTATKFSVTNKEHQSGQYALMVQKSSPANEFDTEFAHNSLIRVPLRVKIDANQVFIFGGWIKSSPLRKSLAGFKMSWFDENQQLLRDDYTNFTPNSNDWHYFSAETKPPANAEYGKFCGVVLGTEAEVYFDNVAVYQDRSTGAVPLREKDNMTFAANALKLSLVQSGLWTLSNNEKSLDLDGELVLTGAGARAVGGPAQRGKPAIIESRQSYYSRGRASNYLPNESVAITSQIVHPLSLQLLNIPMEASVSPTLSINYTFSAELGHLIADKQLSLTLSLPIDELRLLRVVNDSEIQDKSFYDAFSEKNVTEIDMGVSNNILALKYSAPVDISVKREADVLYFVQTILPAKTEPANNSANPDVPPGREEQGPGAGGFNFGMRFEAHSVAQNQEEWAAILNEANEAAKNNNPGEAIELYRRLALEADKKSDIFAQGAQKLATLESEARSSARKNNELLDTARILKDTAIYQQALKAFQEISRTYRQTEYAAQAQATMENIKQARQQLETAKKNNNAERVLRTAEGSFKEKQFILAGVLYQQIIRDYGDTPAAQTAKDKLAQLKELNK